MNPTPTNFTDLEKKLNFSFKDKSLLAQAFIHRSYLNEASRPSLESNERLEFLGDAVLELAVSEFLYLHLPGKPEGELTSLRSSLVKTDTLAQVATKLNLGTYLKMSRGEELGGGKTNKSLLANTTEALLGAIYLDHGLSQVVSVVERYLFPKLSTIINLGLHRDSKSTLQEKVQSQGLPTPEYYVLTEKGPDHQKTFVVEVLVGNKKWGEGKGSSKQRAETQAARDALAMLEKK
ncbi:MAG: ribonuclease III [Candidatus Chisholmbacteria bacterium]|nr:ribonuclease III [Candidatus Chisholmbacteria bacterium]